MTGQEIFLFLVLGRDKQKNLSTAAVPIITSDILSDVNLKHSVRAYRYYSQLFGLYLALLNIDKDYDDTIFLRLIFSLQISWWLLNWIDNKENFSIQFQAMELLISSVLRHDGVMPAG